MKKRILTLVLAITLTLSATACGSKADVKTSAENSEVQAEEETEVSNEEAEEAQTETEVEVDAFAAAQENVAGVNSLEGQMIMEMNMELSANGQSQAVESVTTMDMVCFNDPRKIKIEINIDMGDEGSAVQSFYAEVEEDGTAVMYVYDGANWQSQVVGAMDLAPYDASTSMLSYMNDGTVYTLEGMEAVNGANAYKYASVVSGEAAKEMILSSGGLDSLTAIGMDAAQLESLLDDVEEFTEYVWIDEATLYPVKYETDMTDVMDTVMSSALASMGEQAEGLNMSITKMKMAMTCSNFDSAADFTIPEEAKAN